MPYFHMRHMVIRPDTLETTRRRAARSPPGLPGSGPPGGARSIARRYAAATSSDGRPSHSRVRASSRHVQAWRTGWVSSRSTPAKKGLGLVEEPSVDAAPARPMRRPGKVQLVLTVLEQTARIVEQHGTRLLEKAAREVRQVGPPREYPPPLSRRARTLVRRTGPAGNPPWRSGSRAGAPPPARSPRAASATGPQRPRTPRTRLRHRATSRDSRAASPSPWPGPPTRGSSPRRFPDAAPPLRSGRWRGSSAISRRADTAA